MATATYRRGCSGPLARVVVGFAGAVALSLAAAPLALSHPTDAERLQSREERSACESEVPAEERVDPARLGMSLSALREAVSGLRAEPEPEASDTPEPSRWVRDTEGELARVEYELFRDRVYRIRWRLAEAYERPLLDALVERARRCFGRPDFDQTFEAEPGFPAATYRRVGWSHGERRIELRQLHPLRGGPVYLTLSSTPALRELVAAGLAPHPEPVQSAPWWQRPMTPLEPAAPAEREARGKAFVRLLAQLDH